MARTRPGPWTRALATVLLPALWLLAGCSGGEDDPAAGAGDDDLPEFNGIDTSLSCPAGQVGWNFATGGSTLGNAQGSALSGIQLVSASYGKNCNSSLAGNATSAATSKCNGEYQCSYTPGFSFDPAVNCAKNFEVTWQCGAESTPQTVQVGGEAGGKPVELNCGPQINVVAATYGQNCGVPVGTHTSQMRAQCDAKRACTYKVEGLGDPAYNCRKDYDVVYTCGSSDVRYTKHLNGEAGGQSLSFACEAAPTIKVQDALYGASCGVSSTPIAKTSLAGACDGKTSCEYKISTPALGDPARNCRKSWNARYTCGDSPIDYFVNAQGEADGTTVKLRCEGAGTFKPAPNAEYATGRRACVPRQCSWQETRDANMACVLDPSKALISAGAIVGLGFVDKNGGLNSNLVANTPYTTSLQVDMIAPQGARPRMVPWLTARFSGQGTAADGFICAMTPVELNKDTPANVLQRVQSGGKPAILPPDCFDVRANPWADAARRRNMSERDFRAAFTQIDTKIHFSIDPEGAYGFVKTPNVVPLAPNPPGFFYDQATDYVDMMAFYQQRELKGLPGGQTTDMFSLALVRPTTLDVNVTGAKITDGAYRDLDWFSTENPDSSIDVTYTITGDWPANPYSPTSAQTRVQSLRARNLRATVEVFPYNDEGGGIVLASIPLTDSSPSGAVKSATVKWSNALRDKIFGQWGGVSSVDMKVCIDVDGLNTRNGGTSTLRDNATGYAANINNGNCFRQSNALIFSRSFIKRPLSPDAKTFAVAKSSSNASGDSKTSAAQDTGEEKGCTETGQGASMVQNCTSNRRQGMGANGDLGRKYYSTASASKRVETPTQVTAAPALEGEALGYQVVDVDDDDQQLTFAKTGDVFKSKAPVKISITPNWDLLVATLRAQPPPKPEWNKGIYGGQMGLGVGIGSKVPFGGFGLLTISATVGVSLGLDFELRFQPEEPYACINNTGTKCFMAIPSAMTQPQGVKACQVRGGRLAEMVTANDRAGILAVAQSNQNHWLGGQLAYAFSSVACARNQGSNECKNASTTQYRWIGTDQIFATSSGQSSPSGFSGNTTAPAGDNGLTTMVPTNAGVVFQGNTKRLSTAQQSQALPPVCEFDAAASTGYSSWSIALNLGAGAGVGMSFCTPTDDLGLCLVGQLNFVDLSLKPTLGHTAFTLYDASQRRIGTRGNSYVDVPWQLSLLTGQVQLTANFIFFSLSWTIASYDGFRVAGGSLYRYDSPSRENF